MNEFDVLRQNLPLEENISKYLCVKVTVNRFEDQEFRVKTNLESMARKFGHSSWTEMKPLIVGIKCYTREEVPAGVFVFHSDRKNENRVVLDSFDAYNETWCTFKFPLVENYHTETRIMVSEEVTAYTLAIMNTAQCIRYQHDTNYFPPGYTSFDTGLYGEHNKALVYVDGDKTINPSSASLEKSILVNQIQSKI
jgi:hypothetical protein